MWIAPLQSQLCLKHNHLQTVLYETCVLVCSEHTITSEHRGHKNTLAQSQSLFLTDHNHAGINPASDNLFAYVFLYYFLVFVLINIVVIIINKL